jgi:PleD family two-component response regulator
VSVADRTEGSFFYVLDEPANILFVDDDPILREFALVHLSTDVARVTVAEDGLDALEKLKGASFDILLIDIDMPRMNGFQLVEAVRSQPALRHVPIIVETGREDVAAVDRAFNLGADSFTVKPINWRLLSYQIRFALRAARQEQALRTARQTLQERVAQSARNAEALVAASADLLNQAATGPAPLRAAASTFVQALSAISPVQRRSDAA